MSEYVEKANAYMRGVLDGSISACEYVKRACERQERDLAREDFPWVFDTERASAVCEFIELLPHIKGRYTSLIELRPWQVFILTTVFGWVDSEGYRRFKTVYLELPRKQGKSTISSGVALYMLCDDGEPGAEIVSAATTRDQARIVWGDAKRMVERSPGLRNRFGVTTAAHSVVVGDTASSFKPLSRDQGGNLDGLNIHCAIIDELHGHKTRDIWDVLETATGSRKQPLVWAITTAGSNRAGICYEQRAYALRVLNRLHDDESYCAVIYTIDEDDDWTKESSWIKANPNWGISVNPEDMARKVNKAMQMAAAQNNLLTKHMNVWVNADTAWMDLRKWDNCAVPDLDMADFEGQPCWIGLDLANKADIAALVLVFERPEGGIAVFGRYYLPEDAVEDGRNSQYSGWAIEGRLIATPGSVTDFAYIEQDLREFASRFDVRCVAYDPWQASYLAQRLGEDGLPMLELRQTVQNMSEPMKQLEAYVLKNELKHDGCPVLGWMISNVVAHLDAKENIYPRKEFPENKIDAVVALIMAISRYLFASQAGDLDAWLSDPVMVSM